MEPLNLRGKKDSYFMLHTDGHKIDSDLLNVNIEGCHGYQKLAVNVGACLLLILYAWVKVQSLNCLIFLFIIMIDESCLEHEVRGFWLAFFTISGGKIC